MLAKLLEKDRKRLKRKIHVRKRISGTAERPRMTVTRSNKNLSVQLIDDTAEKTLLAVSTLQKELSGVKCTVAGATQVGELVGKKALEANITAVVFDRNGYLYHGRIKALADGARKSGLKF
jgi:large subunit ribosomal protein L18